MTGQQRTGLIESQGSNDITLRIADGDLSPALMEKAEAYVERQKWCWNLIVVISPQEKNTQPELFEEYSHAGSESVDNKHFLKFIKRFRVGG